MTDHQLQKRKVNAYLCAAMDKAADEFAGKNFQTVEHACMAIHDSYPDDLDIKYQVPLKQMGNKINWLAKSENTKAMALLKTWKTQKSGYGFYREYTTSIKDQAQQPDTTFQPNATTLKKLKFLKAQSSAKKTAPSGTQGDDEDGAASNSAANIEESDPEDGTYIDEKADRPRTTVSEKNDTSTKPGKTAPADSKARPTANTLQPSTSYSAPPRTKFSISIDGIPNHKDIARELNSVLQSLNQGIRHFREVHPLVKLTTTRLTDDSVTLSRELLRPSAEHIHQVERNLVALFADPAITMDLVFRAYGAVAVNDWIFNSFDDFVNPPDSQILSSVRQLDRGIYDQLKLTERTKHFDGVKVTFQQQAEKAERRLLDVFESLGGPPASFPILAAESTAATGTHGDIEHRAVRHSLWQAKVRSAFSQALNLRIKLARSPMGYEYNWPRIGHKYDTKYMKSVHDDKDQAEDEPPASILLCLRPAIYSIFNNDRLLIVPALVMLQGFGEPLPENISLLRML
ncbi:hypothetical protein LTR10_016987 [Elasticomyces elasticus]|uniref:Uncharacterized protein n=1 Tax=Exophiala sideris TaxID=1016849 RepID=A0ABR0JF00_9EURO|nr:hypothetical protein LTR10_016987 [Elasticomyces elasticus]KAK5025241.1 hypothetical protein LTS07_008092 [Exophiala sideris]KAK5029211.1 hypothetical protein LTR13_008748 [Exophiala sideris]KAK5063300.1 hypothetical protein LTR69_004006 [Exophiala sideris]KAK5179016.1 hypothetical protein LTR44_008505 [Eurotiomycetes sp. CCFEE 6388]